MKKIAAFLLALIMGMGFTLALVSAANAKIAFVAYGSKSMAPNGAFSDWKFTGEPAFGGGVRFGMDGRFSFGLDYMGQKMAGGYFRSPVTTGQTFIDLAGRDLSEYGVQPNTKLYYFEETNSGTFNVITGAFYVSLMPETGSRLIVEPVIGFVGGASLARQNVDFNAYYHPRLDEIFGYHFQFADDDGDGHGRSTQDSYKLLAGMSFGLNFFPVENLIIVPEIRYLYNFGFTARTGIGVAF